ncbi:MAG: Xaa-Pro peptidase family protein [Actinobacteria bacterium]|jgi:Xaa-Pro aminopeptidase|nr:Xaa-Pro peptidase family protein [Actinomycetota bacterium]
MTEPAFDRNEYAAREQRVRARMEQVGLDHLVVGDPAGICYLTGFEGFSFYVPQAVVVSLADPLTVIVREIDASSVVATTHLTADQVLGYPERFVQNPDAHPMTWAAAQLAERLHAGQRVGVEVDAAHWTVASHRALTVALPASVELIETPAIVAWVRARKSPTEIAMMREAGRITEQMFATALDSIRPGTRQCDAVADITRAQIAGTRTVGGSWSAIPPLVLAGEHTAYPHVPWTDAPFGDDEPIALELSGAVHRYHAPVARTMYLGTPPVRLRDLAAVVDDGARAALDVIREGARCEEVALAWNSVIERHGLTKSSRVGYPIGIGFPPDWGEQTMSLRVGDRTVMEAGMTFHVMIGMWLDGWGYSTSESVVVTEDGHERLAAVPGGLVGATKPRSGGK